MNPERILAIHVTRIGDTLMTTPSLRFVAQKFPQAKIHFLGHPKRYTVLSHLPYLSSVGHISKKSALWRGRAPFLPRYDLALVWGQDEALVDYALRVADRVIAYQQKDERLNSRVTKTAPFVQNLQMPLSRGQFQLLEGGLGADMRDADVCPDYVVSDAERTWARSYIAARTNLPVVGLVTRTFPTFAARDWPPEHFTTLAGLLAARYPYIYFLHLGTENTCPPGLAQLLGSRFHDASGQLTLRQSSALINELALYIGLDTGPSHIAGALGVPMVVMFHCTVRPPLPFAPHHPERTDYILHPCPDEECTPDTSMAAITPEQVFSVICARLDKQLPA